MTALASVLRLRRALRFGASGCTALGLAFALACGCGQNVIVGVDDAIASAGSGGGSGAGGSLLAGADSGAAAGEPGTAGAAPCQKTLCRGQYYQCGNCDDDDGDGKLDAEDPECLGPCDDDEVGLSTGLKVSGGPPCRLDCYFDADAGPGNDMCDWSQQCDRLSVAPDYPPSGDSRCEFGVEAPGKPVDCAALAQQPTACVESCLPLVPNGCDCFGCCELPARSQQFHFIGRGRGALGCELDALDDPEACPPCTPVKSCFNECDPCEACVGSELDPTCSAPAACPSGQACGIDAPCPVDHYCVTGCCVSAPVPR